MTELMLKMTFWLIAAMILGFIVAWLLAKIVYRKKYHDNEDTASAIIFERNNMISKLEKKIRNEKIMSKKLSNDLENSMEALSDKTSLLTSLTHRIESNDDITALTSENMLLKKEVKQLKIIDGNRLIELVGFEDVLVKAEEKFEKSEIDYKQLIKTLDEDIERLTLENEIQKSSIALFQKNIADLEDELTLCGAGKTDAEFIISKDQFQKIEEQLESYQQDIALLKNENSELRAKKTPRELQLGDSEMLEGEIVDSIKKESNDSSMVKVFRETYRKITKS